MAIEVLLFVNEEERVVAGHGETLRDALVEAWTLRLADTEIDLSDTSPEEVWEMVCRDARMRAPIPGKLIQGLVPCDKVQPDMAGTDMMLVVDADRLWWTSGVARRV